MKEVKVRGLARKVTRQGVEFVALNKATAVHARTSRDEPGYEILGAACVPAGTRITREHRFARFKEKIEEKAEWVYWHSGVAREELTCPGCGEHRVVEAVVHVCTGCGRVSETEEIRELSDATVQDIEVAWEQEDAGELANLLGEYLE